MNAREKAMTDIVILNGFEVSTERANTIMFVQCTVLRKKYTINTNVTPIVISIDGYEPDENDMKPDSEFKRLHDTKEVPDPGNKVDSTPRVKKCGTCGKHAQQ